MLILRTEYLSYAPISSHASAFDANSWASRLRLPSMIGAILSHVVMMVLVSSFAALWIVLRKSETNMVELVRVTNRRTLERVCLQTLDPCDIIMFGQHGGEVTVWAVEGCVATLSYDPSCSEQRLCVSRKWVVEMCEMSAENAERVQVGLMGILFIRSRVTNPPAKISGDFTTFTIFHLFTLFPKISKLWKLQNPWILELVITVTITFRHRNLVSFGSIVSIHADIALYSM